MLRREVCVALALLAVLLTPCLSLPGQLESSPESRLRNKRQNTDLKCGVRNGEPSKEDSEETSPGEFPWMVDVAKKSVKTASAQCGGSLVRKDVVLTAASCVVNAEPEDLSIRVGVWDRSSNTTDLFQEGKVARVVVHGGYGSTAPFINDVALIFLKEPFDLKDNVSPVCLPEKDVKMETTKCLATGWGFNYLDGVLPRTKLRKVYLPLVDRNVCEKKISEFKKNNFTVHESFVCAGGLNKDTCSGDGGGPLVCPLVGEPDRFAQLGIVAWGISCDTFLPSGYSSVPYHLDWITKNLSK